MSNFKNTFKNKAFVGYLTAGDGGLENSLMAMHALVAGGVDILEIGVPFSDPIADGPTIQAASARALKSNITIENILQLISRFKNESESEIPIILFSYYNPIYQAKQNNPNFYADLKAHGVDGCLIVDLPLEEMDYHYHACINHQIDPIFLISPSTPMPRIQMIASKARGMLYYVCRKGTTGIKNDLPNDFKKRLTDIQSITKLPVVVGFGVSNRNMTKTICEYADGFVVGSLFVNAIAAGFNCEQLIALTKSLDPR